MSIDFSEYITCIDENNTEHREAIEASYNEAQRVMSPRGLQNYLEGVRAFCTLGRGQDLVMTYIQEMPGVVKEVGEDIIPDVVEGMMKLSSHTSGSVITLIVQHLPLAASRLGDAEVMRGFLKLLHQMTGKAPRGLRPMMENLDEFDGEAAVHGPFDLVLANILAQPLKVLAPVLVELSSKGQLVLAGLLDRQAEELIDIYLEVSKGDCQLEIFGQKDGWTCLWKRPQTSSAA